MRMFRIVADVAMGLIVGGFLYAVASWLVPRLEGPLTLALLLAGSVLAVMLRKPDTSTDLLTRDVNALLPPILMRVLMAWITAILLVAVLALALDLVWQKDLPRWAARTVLTATFALWFVPVVRRRLARDRSS